MKRKTIITKETGTEQGTVWHWQIKEGRKVIFGGYCRTKKDAANDAASVGGGGAEQVGDGNASTRNGAGSQNAKLT